MNPGIDWKKGVDVFFTDRVQRRTILVLELVLLALLAASLAGLTWRLLGAGGVEVAPPPLPRVAPAGPAASPEWNLAQRHLFGVQPAQPRQQRASVESLPETRLNLTLRGVVATDGADRVAGAIVGAPGGEERFYAVDGNLPGGAVLKEVYADRVVLERNGRLETLRLPRDRIEGATTAPAAPAAPPDDLPGVAPGPPGVEDFGGGEDMGSPAVGAEPELTLEQYRELALTEPAQVADAVRVAPATADGRVVGYEVQPGRDPALLGRLGLAAGDVVTSVNGIGLDSPARALGILRSLEDTGEIRVEILRDGVPQTLFVNVSD